MDIQNILEFNRMQKAAEKLTHSLTSLEKEICKLPDTEEFQSLYDTQAEAKENFNKYFKELGGLLAQIMEICQQGMNDEDI
ncbi:MAG: hypothetical protein KAS32_10370 [Candidatus Peribacteraceae bacterium]|nr:hypothetical protein [Candidatus Peribacteraceae bacterium]